MAYRYVGPDEIRRRALHSAAADIARADDVAAWMVAEPVTFVVTLRVAPRRSEHVACARGEDVLAAGEMSFGPGPVVEAVSNQSTGYCPDPDSWPAVAAALDKAGISRPENFTDPVVFRRCPACGERNLVRDADFTCAPCGGSLPDRWNFQTPASTPDPARPAAQADDQQNQ
jgi:hypothetical protein